MPGTAIITVRLDPALLDALKKRAREHGRSLSAEVVQLIRTSVDAPAPRRGRRKRTMGMLAGQFEDLDIGEFKRMRRAVSEAALEAVERRARRQR